MRFWYSATIAHLKKAAEKAQLKKDIDNIVFTKSWNDLTNEDFLKLTNSGYTSNSYIKKLGTDDTGYKTLYFLELPMKKNGLADKINAIMNDETYGKILRAKGFFNENYTWYQFNATSNEFEINEMPVGQQVFIIIGEEINESKVKELFS